MRRSIVFASAITLLVACSTKGIDFQTPVQDDVVFYASFEQPGDEGTKVYANEDLLLRWTADDRVSIFNKNTYNQQYQFIGETGDYEGGFNKIGDPEFITGDPIPDIVSVYPFQRLTRVSPDETVTVTLPSEQAYAQNSFGLGANTMVSVSSDNLLKFRNVGGYLMLKLYGEGVSVRSITLKGNNGEKLAGTASITMPLNGIPSVEMASDATTEITLKCTTPVQLGATEEESVQFWFVVPPVTFSKGFTITVRESVGYIEKSTSRTLTIERNKLSKMSPIEVPLPAPRQIDSLALVAIYNASDGANWKEGRRWDLTRPMNEWYNVKLNDAGRVTQVNLANGTITAPWTLPAAVGDLTEMTNFRIVSCQLTGAIPDEIYNMTKLVSFYLTKNTPTWTLSSKIAGMTDLKDLYIDQNPNLTGTLPKELGQLKKLANINVSQTGISGSIPAEMSGCSALANLMAYKTQITGIPDNFDQWPALKLIHLYGNPGLTGPLPVSVGNCTKLTSVWLYECNFTGNMPESWANLPATCTQLRIQNNKLKGVVPDAIQAHANFSKWNAEKYILPQQDGYGLVLGIPVPDVVDMGLSVKWASFNLGASIPEESGDYYAWGETEPHYSSQDPLTWKDGKEEGYTWSSYKWSMGDLNTMIKYCNSSSYGYNGFTDTKSVLDLEDDAAHVNLGGNWRMPTDAEWTELRENCTWTWTTQNGVNGMLVTSSNGNSIFLPAAGGWNNVNLYHMDLQGDYRSSSLGSYSFEAWYVDFNSGSLRRTSSYRYVGLSVRPVYTE